MSTPSTTVKQTNNWRSLRNWTMAAAVMLTLSLTSTRAGTTTIVGMPATSTDAGSGIFPTNAYVCAFDYGTSTSAISINSVPFTHFQLAAVNVFSPTNVADVHFGGHVVLSAGGPNNSKLASTSNTTGLSAQADGSMVTLLTDCVYPGAVSQAGDWIKQDYQNLTPGNQYSLRIYYRKWNNEATSTRLNSFTYDDGDATNLTVIVDPDTGGAQYIAYDFTAYRTNASCLISNLLNGFTVEQPWLTYGATMQCTFTNIYPFLLNDASTAGQGDGTYKFNVLVVGPSLSFQWYYNTVSNYSGATPATDGNDYSGSTTGTLTATNNLLDYYFVIVTNSNGSVTSSIVQINPAPVILTQPSPVNNAYASVTYTNLTSAGVNPVTYQWYYNTINDYSGATAITADGNGYSGSATRNLTSTTNLQDFYFAVVTNVYGSATSAITSFYPIPTITQQPTNFIAGSVLGFSMTADGWPILGYQWYDNTSSSYDGATAMVNGGAVTGAGSNTVTVANLNDYFFVVVSNYYGSITSSIVQEPQISVLSAGEPIWNTAGQTNVIVTFSYPVDPASAAITGNYALDNSATVTSATVVASNEVLLVTSTLNPLTSYTLTVQNVTNTWTVVQTPNPTSIPVALYPANIALWVRADTGVTTNSDGTVTQWNDRSGNGNNLSSGDIVVPLLTNNAWGDPVIRFGGTNYMFASDSPSLHTIRDMTIIFAGTLSTNVLLANRGEIANKMGAAPNNNRPAPFELSINNALKPTLLRGNGTANGAFTAPNAGFNPALPVIMMATENGNTISHYFNGFLLGSGLSSFAETNIADAGQLFYIGKRADNAVKFYGDMSELIIAGSAVSAYDVAALNSYLVAQHHIPVLVNTSPVRMTFAATNSQLTLSWPSDHLGWQLQSNSVGLLATDQWFTVAGSRATNVIMVPVSTTDTNVFYRMSAQ
jgi:hypothetical protein